MYLKHGLAGLAKSASSESAMASDTSALYWYAPDSVVESGGTITSWDDKTSNGNDLAQVSTLNMPSFVSGSPGYVDFDGTEVIGLSTFPFANSARNAWGTSGTGEYAIFIVGLANWGAASSNDYVYMTDGTSTAFDSTTQIHVRAQWNTGGGDIGRLVGQHRPGSAGGLQTLVPATQTAPAATALQAVHVSSIIVTQSARSGEINDAAFTGSDTAPTDSATSQDGLFIGGYCNGTTLNNGWLGRIYEVFATGDASTANVDAIRAELITKYSI